MMSFWIFFVFFFFAIVATSLPVLIRRSWRQSACFSVSLPIAAMRHDLHLEYNALRQECQGNFAAMRQKYFNLLKQREFSLQKSTWNALQKAISQR